MCQCRNKLRFFAIRFRLVVVFPSHRWRQAHQDGFDAAIGLKPEERAFIVDKIELHITATPYLLPMLLLWRKGQRLSPCDNRQVGLNKGIPRSRCEVKPMLRRL